MSCNYDMSSRGCFLYFLCSGCKVLSPGVDSMLCLLKTYLSLSRGLTILLYCISILLKCAWMDSAPCSPISPSCIHFGFPRERKYFSEVKFLALNHQNCHATHGGQQPFCPCHENASYMPDILGISLDVIPSVQTNCPTVQTLPVCKQTLSKGSHNGRSCVRQNN